MYEAAKPRTRWFRASSERSLPFKRKWYVLLSTRICQLSHFFNVNKALIAT